MTTNQKEYMRNYMVEYNKKPGYILYIKEYLQKPEVKKRRAEMEFERRKRPEVKQYHDDYQKKNRKKISEYKREYCRRNKDKINVRVRELHKIKKDLKEEQNEK